MLGERSLRRNNCFKQRVIFFLSAVAFLLPAQPSEAAELRKVDRPHCIFELSGPIESGDARKVANVLSQKSVEPFCNAAASGSVYPLMGHVCLNSAGGNYVEGLKIAKHFMALGIGTVVDAGAQCLSACALVFMAGTMTDGGTAESAMDSGPLHFSRAPSRRLHKDGQLGFHAPYLMLSRALHGNRFEASEIEAAFGAAVLAISELLNIARRQGADGRGAIISISLIAEMLRHGPREVLLVDNIDKAGRWGIDVFGFAVPPAITRLMRAHACHNLYWWKNDHSAELRHIRALKDPRNAEQHVPEMFTSLHEYIKREWGLLGTTESPDIIDESGGETNEIYLFSSGYEAAVTCQIATSRSHHAIALRDRSLNIGIGTHFSHQSKSGHKVYFGQAIPIWYMLDPETKLRSLPAELARRKSNVTYGVTGPTQLSDFSFSANKAFRWGGQPAQTVASLAHCQSLCETSLSCRGFTHFRLKGLCRLMETLSELLPDTTADSGFKTGPGR